MRTVIDQPIAECLAMLRQLLRPDAPDTVPNHPVRKARSNVMLMAKVEHFRCCQPTSHRVRDLSTNGVRIDNAEKMLPGETVRISIGAVRSIAATIKWVRQGFAGLAFETEINIDEARKHVAASPKPIARPKLPVASSVPTVGWFSDLKSPYRD